MTQLEEKLKKLLKEERGAQMKMIKIMLHKVLPRERNSAPPIVSQISGSEPRACGKNACIAKVSAGKVALSPVHNTSVNIIHLKITVLALYSSNMGITKSGKPSSWYML